MRLDERLTGEIVRRVLSVAPAYRIIVFGSAAAGKMKAESDIDLLVIEPQVSNARTESVRIGDALRGLGFSFDVVVMPHERFEETKNVVGGIAYPASRHGRVLYEAA